MRELTAEENEVLADVVVDPVEWWAHVQSTNPNVCESMLASKVARYKPAFDAKDKTGYQTRAEIEAAGA